MAAKEEYPLGSPQEHALMCVKHKSMPVDVTCQDCEEFICSNCVKENHKDHNWQTIQTAATLTLRGLLKSMTKIKKEDIRHIDKKIIMASKRMEENQTRYAIEVSKLQAHYDEIVRKLFEIKKKHENVLRERIESNIAVERKDRSNLEEKKKRVQQLVESLTENSGSMTDIILLKTHRELTKLLSTGCGDIDNSFYSLRYESGDTNEVVLGSMMGEIFDAEKITVTQTDSFQWGDETIFLLEAMNEDTCLLKNDTSPYLEKVNKKGRKEKKISVGVGGVCITDNNEVYVTDGENNSISRLSPSGAVSIVFSTDPLAPLGICQTMDGDLLVTMMHKESDPCQLDPCSQRLVRHVTLTGDVIREYEYQEDGQTRLFALPLRVTQNNNTDVCVINLTESEKISELVILSLSGSLKSVYRGRYQNENIIATDVVCDSHSNIIVSELHQSTIHLLNPDGKFLKYLLTGNQINEPTAMSLKKSTLWVGNSEGLVKVFRYSVQ